MIDVSRAMEKDEGGKDQKAEERFAIGASEGKKESSNGDSASRLHEESSWKSDSRLGDGSQLIQPPDHSYSAEQFRKVKTHILHQTPTPRSILVTSAVPKEGKSMVAFNLALSFAQEKNIQTILIDADLRNPSLSRELSMERDGIGLSDYLVSDKWGEDFLKRLTPNLKFMPSGISSSKAPELNGFSRMKELLGEFLEKSETGKEKEEGRGKRRDNYIFIDGPPILVTSDPIIFSKLVDGIILVVMSDLAPKKAIRKAVDSIDREKIVGVVFNQINLKPSKHYSQFYDRYYRE
jgi:capsular exopolysaccharide synthesis family protein